MATVSDGPTLYSCAHLQTSELTAAVVGCVRAVDFFEFCAMMSQTNNAAAWQQPKPDAEGADQPGVAPAPAPAPAPLPTVDEGAAGEEAGAEPEPEPEPEPAASEGQEGGGGRVGKKTEP